MDCRWIGIWILLFPAITQAEDFPTLCPSKQNLAKVCEALKNIPLDKTLVFADGSEMPACGLQTTSAEEIQNQNKLRVMTAKLFTKYQRVHPLPVQDPHRFNDILTDPTNLQRLKRDVPFLRKDLEDFETFRNSTKVTWRYMTISNPFTRDDLQNTIQKTDLLLKQVPQGNTLSPFLKKIGKYDLQGYESRADCKSPPTAFLLQDSQNSKVKLSAAIQAYPKGTKKFIVAHEVGHQIDPCTIKATNKNDPLRSLKDDSFSYLKNGLTQYDYPFEKLVSCLQNDVGHFIQLPPTTGQKKTAQEPEKEPNYHCSQNHSREAFCDHVGVSLIAEELKSVKYSELKKDPNKIYMPKGYEYAFFFIDGSCAGKGNEDSTTHPSDQRRLFDIFLKNPTMAKALGCSVDLKAPYCDLVKGTMNKPIEKAASDKPKAAAPKR